MINNIVKRAEYKLSMHRQLGSQSNLTIFEVAKLLDTIKKGEQLKNQARESVFFSYSMN